MSADFIQGFWEEFEPYQIHEDRHVFLPKEGWSTAKEFNDPGKIYSKRF